MSLKIYINEQLIELERTDNIGLTFQAYSIINPSNRSGFLSNTISAPKTKNNNIIFESLSNVNSATNLPYEQINAKLVQDGIELVPNGFAILEETSDNYRFTVYSGNVSFFDLIKDRTVNDVDLTAYTHVWNSSNIIASFANTTGYIYPIIEWGKGFDFLNNGSIVDEADVIPCLFLQTVISKTGTLIGYTIQGDILNLPEIVLTPAKFGFTQEEANAANGNSSFFDQFPPINSTTINAGSGTVEFPVPTPFDTFSSAEFSTNQYIAANLIFGNISFSAQGSFNTVPTGDYINVGIRLTIKKNGVIAATQLFQNVPQLFQSPNQQFVNTLTLNNQVLNQTDTWSVEVFAISNEIATSYDLNVKLNGCNFSITAGTNFVVNANIAVGTMFTQKLNEVFLDLANMYGFLIQTNEVTRKIEFNYFDKIITNISKSLDWSSKINPEKTIKVKYSLNNFAQRNYFKYVQEETVDSNEGLGWIDVTDTNLEIRKDMVTLKSAAAEMTNMINNEPTPLVRIREGANIAVKSAKNRFLILDRKETSPDLQIGYTTHTGTVPFSYFKKIGKTDNLDFNSLIATNYKALRGMLNKVKYVSASFILNELDVIDFDFTIPIFLDYNDGTTQINGYFYCNKISNFKKGKDTTVELIRL